MKNIFVFMILFSIHLNAQTNEFKVYDNGLIYSENAVDKLKHIVDSLNLKFKVCEFNKTFLSCAQAKANYVSLEKVNVLEAKKDLEKNISYQDFKAKYTKAVFEENLVVVKSIYSHSRNKVNVNFSSLELGECSNKRIRSEERVGETEIKGKWVFDFQEKTKYSEVSLEAFYFIEEFQAKPIADKYARLIQYSDCMIDTTAQVFMIMQKNRVFVIELPYRLRLKPWKNM